jgi:hypothetical protein
VIGGTVLNVAPFGLFVELVPGRLEGILRSVQTPYAEIARIFRVVQRVEVIVKDVNPQKEVVRVELLPDPTRHDGFWQRQERRAELPWAKLPASPGWPAKLAASPTEQASEKRL